MTRPPSRAFLFALLVALLTAVPAWGEDAGPTGDLRPAARSAVESLVEVTAHLCTDTLPVEVPQEHAVSRNTGFFVGTDGQVLTSALGIAGSESITVRTIDGRRAAARVVAFDQAAGLALLRSEIGQTRPVGLREEPVRPGDLLALAACCPHEGPLLRAGLVSKAEVLTRLHGVQWTGLCTVSVACPAGSAAAPLLDARGELAGLVLAADVGGAEPRALMLPADGLRPILARLERGESRQLGWLGLSVVRESGELEGARVAEVLESSPAHRAGILPGDILLEFDEEPLQRPEALARLIATGGPRRNVGFSVLRGGQLRTGTVDIEPRPLLICAAAQRPGEDRFRLRRPRGADHEALTREQWRRLIEENRRLREQLHMLESRPETAE